MTGFIVTACERASLDKFGRLGYRHVLYTILHLTDAQASLLEYATMPPTHTDLMVSPESIEESIASDKPDFVKKDGDKLGVHLLPVRALEEITKVLDFGAKKYAPNNWRRVDRRSRYYSAALRHLFAYWRGEDFDPESGLRHLAHAGCCVMFLLSCEVENLGADDRPGRE